MSRDDHFYVFFTNDKNDVEKRYFDNVGELDSFIRERSITADDPRYMFHAGGRPITFRVPTPQIEIVGAGETKTDAVKPKRKRRTKAEMEAARANGEKTRKRANGHDDDEANVVLP